MAIRTYNSCPTCGCVDVFLTEISFCDNIQNPYIYFLSVIKYLLLVIATQRTFSWSAFYWINFWMSPYEQDKSSIFCVQFTGRERLI